MPQKKNLENMFLSSNKKREKTRLYSASYLKLELVPDDADKTKPYRLLCCKSLCNDSMKNKKLENHRKNIHSEHAEKPLEYFRRLNENRHKNNKCHSHPCLRVQSNLNKRGLQASNKLSFLLAKKSRPHTRW